MKNPSYLAIPFVLITALALLPSGCVALFGGFSSKVVLSLSVTPDLRLDLTKRASFPAKEFIDPAVKLDALLIEERSSDIIARATVKLSEDSDYVTPRLTIAGGRAVLSGFDRRTLLKNFRLHFHAIKLLERRFAVRVVPNNSFKPNLLRKSA